MIRHFVNSSSSQRLSMISQIISSKFSTNKPGTIGNIQILSNGSLARLILNKPKALNSLSTQMVSDISDQLQFFNKHKAIWFQGAGGKAFCAGGDVKALFEKGAVKQDRINFFRRQFLMDYKISQLKALQIANWDGIVMGGGVGISAFSPYIIASQNTMYAMPECKIGFFTDVGSSYFLSRLRSNIGYYLGLTGARLKGEDAYVAGLANYFITRQNIPLVLQQLQKGMQAASNAKQFIEETLSKYHKPSGKKQIQNEKEINQIFSKKSVKEIYQTVKNNSSPFHQKIFKMLEDQCPLSVHITHRSIGLSKTRSIREVFLQDYILCQHFVTNQNFSQGVRCLLIDKGDTPKWTHKHLLDVSENQVDLLFKPAVNSIGLGI